MMNILQFKVGGEYDYNVTFETGLEKQRIQTNDRPTGNLLNAISAVVIASIKFFRFESISAQFRQITFSYPEIGPDGFVLEFTIKTKENVYVSHTLKTAKLDLLDDQDETSTDSAYQLRIEQNNALVKKIILLRDAVQSYVKGEREQTELPFEGDDDTEAGDEGSLFEDEDELDITAGNITEFKK